MVKYLFSILFLLLLIRVEIRAQNLQHYNSHPDATFFRSDEASRIGDQLRLWQRNTGGWPKNVDMVTPMTDSLRTAVEGQKSRRNDSTTDNGATSQQMVFLAHLYRHTHSSRFREAFVRGVEYLLDGQYANGGWPQFWPERRGYQWHITYNDDAMVNTMRLLRDVAQQVAPFDDDLTDEPLRQRVQRAFDKGIECILATQIVVEDYPPSGASNTTISRCCQLQREPMSCHHTALLKVPPSSNC